MIGRTKLKLTNKEIGRLGIGEFSYMYQLYKDMFDYELLLLLARKTYAQAEEEQMKRELWD